MAYKSRTDVLEDGAFFHIMWQCHNKDWLLKEDWSKKLYYDLLLKYRDKYEIVYYGYHFMENHIHLAGQLHRLELFSNYFRLVNNLFARNINKRLGRRGQAVMDRFLSPSIKDDKHMLAVLAYIDSNGVRSGRDGRPEESKWSSYHHYANGRKDSLVKTAPTYFLLGSTQAKRQMEYRQLVSVQLRGFQPFRSCSV